MWKKVLRNLISAISRATISDAEREYEFEARSFIGGIPSAGGRLDGIPKEDYKLPKKRERE